MCPIFIKWFQLLKRACANYKHYSPNVIDIPEVFLISEHVCWLVYGYATYLYCVFSCIWSARNTITSFIHSCWLELHYRHWAFSSNRVLTWKYMGDRHVSNHTHGGVKIYILKITKREINQLITHSPIHCVIQIMTIIKVILDRHSTEHVYRLLPKHLKLTYIIVYDALWNLSRHVITHTI